MTIIVTALYAEAKPLIETYNLQKTEDTVFPIYTNEQITLIISGMTPLHSAIATTYILSNELKPDQIINIGICGTTVKEDRPGICYMIRKIIDTQTGKVYHLPQKETNLPQTTVATYATPQIKKEQKHHLVDMESSGFYTAARKFLPPEKIFLYKIVSDHLDPEIPDKSFVQKLIARNLPLFEKMHFG